MKFPRQRAGWGGRLGAAGCRRPLRHDCFLEFREELNVFTEELSNNALAVTLPITFKVDKGNGRNGGLTR